MKSLKQLLYEANKNDKKLQKQLTRKRKIKRRLYQRKRQTTCLCDRYWFPHRYQFTKCVPCLWDKIAIELGFTVKIVNPKRIPF